MYLNVYRFVVVVVVWVVLSVKKVLWINITKNAEDATTISTQDRQTATESQQQDNADDDDAAAEQQSATAKNKPLTKLNEKT